jgi:purine-nucleoside phosphorylase
MPCSDETSDTPVFTAAEQLKFRRARGLKLDYSPPLGVIFTYQPSLIKALGRRLQRSTGIVGDFFLVKETRGQVGVSANFGIGAPAAVVLLEYLAAFGVQKFISIGLAGGLQDGTRPGMLVVCERAIRDDGVSGHYLPDEKYVLADEELTMRMRQTMEKVGQETTIGTSWTTSAPFREMRDQVERHRQDGVLTVDMEAAALLAAGKSLGVQVGAAFSIADSLSGVHWRLDFDERQALLGLRLLFNAAVETLSSTDYQPS